MTTAFPTGLDTLTNPVAADTQDVVPHADQHANANDAIEALQAKVGIDGSADTTTHDYKLSGVTGTDKAVSTANFSGTSSGNNTGDQAIVLTGNVTGSGTSLISVTIRTGVVSEAMLSLSDNTTANVSTGAHGFAPKLPNDAALFLDGTGAFSTPVAAAGDIAITGVVTGSGSSPLTLTHVASTGTGASVLQVGATLSGAILIGGTSSGTTLIGSVISGATALATTMSGAIIVSSTISGATIVNATISGGTITAPNISRRAVTIATASGIALNIANYDLFIITGLTTACLFSISGTDTDGKMKEVRVTSTGAFATTFDSTVRGGTDQTAPTTTTASKTDRWLFEWHNIDSKLDILSVARGY